MLLSYARTTLRIGKPPRKSHALKKAGGKKIFEETASGGRWDRPELHRLIDQFRAGDTLPVWKLDRLSRSFKDLTAQVSTISTGGIAVAGEPH